MDWSRIRSKPSITPDPTLQDVQRASVRDSPQIQSLIDAWGMSSAIQVRPDSASDCGKSALPSDFCGRIKLHEAATGLYQWATCLFVIALVCSQLLGAIWDSKTTMSHLLFGRNLLQGPFQIVGTNDVPYPDRVIACVRSGNYYEPKLVSALLAAPGVSAILEDGTGTAMHGYRLRKRREGSVNDRLDSAIETAYYASCSLIAKTIDNVFDACSALGYTNLTRDSLRVLDDWDSKDLYVLPNTSPVLIMPYWDNAPHARHTIPTWGGDSCMFRLQDAYAASGSASKLASFRGVNRTIRFERTMEWLKRPGGFWKNGWYEDPEGLRWYSDLTSSAKGAPYYMTFRLLASERLRSRWQDWKVGKFIASDKSHNFNSVYIANGTEFGVFIYESYEIHTVQSVFDWETLVSNLSVGLVLIRWVVALVSLHSGAFRGKSLWFSGGIGCVSGAGSFRLSVSRPTSWTGGGLVRHLPGYRPLCTILLQCAQPAGKNFASTDVRRVVYAYSGGALLAALLSTGAASSGWLKGIDGRISTVVFSDEVDKLQLTDYFTSDISWRMNGRVPLIFSLKLAILGMNLVPLLLAHSFPIGNRCANLGGHGVEKALALRAKYVGGLGCSRTYMIVVVNRKDHRVASMSFTGKLVTTATDKNIYQEAESESEHSRSTLVIPVTPLLSLNPTGRCATKDQTSDRRGSQRIASDEIALVNSYELIRLGYLVFGDKYLITFDEWAPFKSFYHFWNHRVLVWTLRPVVADDDAEIAGGRALQSTEPHLWRLDDARLQRVQWWQVSACGIQC